MSNEEAIATINSFINWGEFVPKEKEALTLAISALESIDRITAERDAAEEEIYHGCWNCIHNHVTSVDYNDCDIGGCDYSKWEWRGVQND